MHTVRISCIFQSVLPRCHGAADTITTWLHSRKTVFMFFAGSNPARGVLDICGSETSGNDLVCKCSNHYHWSTIKHTHTNAINHSTHTYTRSTIPHTHTHGQPFHSYIPLGQPFYIHMVNHSTHNHTYGQPFHTHKHIKNDQKQIIIYST